MIIYNKNGFTKFECKVCLNRFKVASYDYCNDICCSCLSEQLEATPIVIESIPLDTTTEQIRLDQRHIETEKIIKKKKK